ncbi:MAG: T9SS type A sorting domain-containing protein [Candidatus Limimorpha sp.]
MMKMLQKLGRILALATAVIAVSFGAQAQTASGDTWYIMGKYVWSPPYPQGSFEYTEYVGDVVSIDGVDYQEIHTLTNGVSELAGAYRVEDEYVFFCKWNADGYEEETLMYDYSLTEGDFFNDDSDYPMQVTEVAFITDELGVQRKQISFVFVGLENETEFWIEGVGSSRGFLNVGRCEPTAEGAVFYLLCFHENENEIVYLNPEYNTCDIDDIEENTVGNDIDLYPNPACGFVRIVNENNMNMNRVELADVFGRTLMSVGVNEEINVSELPAGNYFVRIITDEAVISKKLFVKR